MILSYIDVLGDGNRHTIQATITTAHPDSSYGQPVVVLEDGMPLDAASWFLMGYQVIEATTDEFELLKATCHPLAHLARRATGRPGSPGHLVTRLAGQPPGHHLPLRH